MTQLALAMALALASASAGVSASAAGQAPALAGRWARAIDVNGRAIPVGLAFTLAATPGRARST